MFEWITPKQDELLSDEQRMCNKVKHKNPVLLGVSFAYISSGNEYISVHQIIIISSIKSRMNFLSNENGKKTNAHKLLPTQWINNIDLLAVFSFGRGIKKRISLYQRYF